jgi:arylsulfatase A-like enzyme
MKHFVAVLLALVGFSSSAASAADRRPNILFLVADEYRHDCLGAAGHPIVKTPNLDRLAGGGMRLSRAYVAAPVCSPSRATLFTGRYPQVHGVTTNNMPFAPGEVVLPELLRAQGYTTGMVGKLHLQDYKTWFDYAQLDTEGSSAEYRAFLNARGQALTGAPNTAAVAGSLVKPDQTPLRVGTSVLAEDIYPEAWEADQAIAFIQQQKGKEKPFFLYVSMLKPHSEFVIPAPFDRMYPASEMPLPATFKPGIPMPADLQGADDPPAKKKAARKRGDSNVRHFINDTSILKEVIAHYYGAVTMVDKQMGRVLDALEEAGFRDNTVVVFTADHGNMLGERNRMFKGVMYESSARVPMLYRGPGVKPGQVSDVLLDNATVTPTLLELAGLPVPAGVQGQSIARLLRGEGNGPGVAYSYLRDKMVRKGDWKLIVPLAAAARGSDGPELYNLARDPLEQDNLYDKPEAAAAQRELTALMEAWVGQKPPRVARP